MYSDTPKVLHPLGGRPMLGHVIDAARQLENVKIHVVTGFGSERIKEYFAADADLNWVNQTQQLGTGHAVAQAMSGIPADADSIVLVLCGDVPLTRVSTITDLVNNTSTDGMALLTLVTETPFGLGRILRDAANRVTAIVEEKDASDAQRQVKEINSGIMAFPARRLNDWLGRIDNRNKQGEYYLTDVIALAVADNCSVHTKVITDAFEVQGINDRLQLAQLERHYQMNKANELAKQGVTVKDPARLDIRGELHCGRDVEIDINVIFEGKVTVGDRVRIGPNVVIRDSSIESDSEVLANSHIEGAMIGSGCHVGPFARLRPGSVLKNAAKIGNFVEIKNATIGAGSKANHFAYIGDALIGADANIGAGTIFCNYDGANKHQTVIGDGVFIGSNSTLVAPVTIAANAFVAAGSTISGDVPEDHLAVARGKQRNISGWKRPQKKS